VRLLTLVLLLAALFSNAQASVDTPSAEALLQQMQRAYHHYNFELSLIRVRQGTIEPLRFSHAVLEKSELTHLIYLNGRPSEYLRRNKEISFFETGTTPYTLTGSRMPGFWSTVLEMNLERILESYDPVVTGRNRIAGLPVQVVRLAPKDLAKYGFVLWLEQNSGLLLRLDLIDEGGNLVEQFMGVDLRIMPEPSSWLAALGKVQLPRAVTTQQAYAEPQTELGWAPGWLPKGFKVMSTDRHPLVGTEEQVDYMLVSDGLVDVSIYLSAPEIGMGDQLVRQGATSLLRILNDHKVEVTVVGEVPAQTAQRIAESLHSLAKGVGHD
jgi:sigma-E factor negative regulatory protein RseB